MRAPKVSSTSSHEVRVHFPPPRGPDALHRIKDAIGIVNLIDNRWAFRTKASAAGRMLWVAFKLRDLSSFLIDIGEDSARRFAVEADGGYKLVVLFDAARPGFGIVLDPIVPLLDRRAIRKMAAVALEFGHCGISICFPSLAVRHALAGHDEAPFKN